MKWIINFNPIFDVYYCLSLLRFKLIHVNKGAPGVLIICIFCENVQFWINVQVKYYVRRPRNIGAGDAIVIKQS